MLLLMARPRVTAGEMADFLYPDPDIMPDYFDNTIRIFINGLRKKIARHGWVVKNDYRRGYMLERE